MSETDKGEKSRPDLSITDKNPPGFSPSQTISILSNDDNSNENENESDEISNEKIINKIKCHINNLLKIKIEMRGKEAHKQIISSLDRLNLIFANKNFSFNFDSVNYFFI